ncbi:MAG: hypothetical protein GY696_28285 [Gammaproteobacteria bacterium]|nr:hypothetical protein [Gammaproteobacteria bacterium]
MELWPGYTVLPAKDYTGPCITLTFCSIGGERFLYDISFMVGYRPSFFWSFCWRFITFGIIVVR